MKKSLIILISLSIFSFVLVFGILQNFLVFKHLKEANLIKASTISKSAIFLPKTLNLLTFKQIEIFKLWELAIQETSNLPIITTDVQNYFAQILNNETSDPELANKIIKHLEKINQKLNKIDIKELNEIKLITNDSLIIIKKFLQEDQKYLVILQNSDELRATGGFFGSFFILETKNGQVAPLEIQDVYVPDGQFTGFIQAPPGLDEYLSSGKGLRLPDANWWPNLADSAEQILYFFETNQKVKYQGVIAINLGVVEELLTLTGAIYLPDYNTTVDNHNFAQIARADRNEFFPGSQEKANFLNHFFKIFRLQLTQSLTKNPKASLNLIQKLFQEKDIQIYSRDTNITSILERHKLTGQMFNPQELYYFLVESNVGINKANRLVDRQVQMKIGEEQDRIAITWKNNNAVPYINYQRLYAIPKSEIIDLKVNGISNKKIDQRTFLTKEGQQFVEFGFLVSVLAQGETQVEIELKNPLSLTSKKKLFIQKQSGLPATHYTISYQEQIQNFELTSDQKLVFD